MSEYRPTLERELERLSPSRIPFDELVRRRDRKRRDQRIRASALGIAIAVALVALGVKVLRSDDQPIGPPNGSTTPVPDATGLFAPAKGWIAYATDPYTHDQTLAAVDPSDPSKAVTLAPLEGGQYANPIAWSSDGTHVLLLRDEQGGRNLYVMAADGSEKLLESGFVFGGSFSPDGSKVVYGSGGDLHVVNVDGSDPRKIAGGGGLLTSPSWSPDGSRIAFIDYGEEGSPEPAGIYVIDPDGTDRQVLVDGGELGEDPSWGLSWSPDGTRIAFGVGTPSPGNGQGRIYLVNADGSGPQEVVVPGEVSWPVWSPDGSRLAFVCLPHGEFYANLCVMSLADGTRTRFNDVSFVMDDSLRTIAWNHAT
jgi:Tol biopolymer transport system component